MQVNLVSRQHFGLRTSKIASDIIDSGVKNGMSKKEVQQISKLIKKLLPDDKVITFIPPADGTATGAVIIANEQGCAVGMKVAPVVKNSKNEIVPYVEAAKYLSRFKLPNNRTIDWVI